MYVLKKIPLFWWVLVSSGSCGNSLNVNRLANHISRWFLHWFCILHIWEECMKGQKHWDFIRNLSPSMPSVHLWMPFLNMISCLGLRCRVPGCSGITGLSLEVLKASISNCQMVHLTCLMLRFLPQAVVTTSETSNIKLKPESVLSNKWDL